MYAALLSTHNTMRWLVLLMAGFALYRAYSGWLGKKPFESTDNKAGTFFIASLHLQLLIGLVLYFVSPVVQAALDSGEVMKNPAYRFVAVEHISSMILGIVIAQVGRIRSKKAATDELKHKRAALMFTAGLLIILSRIPWDR